MHYNAAHQKYAMKPSSQSFWRLVDITKKKGKLNIFGIKEGYIGSCKYAK